MKATKETSNKKSATLTSALKNSAERQIIRKSRRKFFNIIIVF
jgi:hypothetical protein